MYGQKRPSGQSCVKLISASALSSDVKREIAEIVIYAVLGITVAPLTGYYLSNLIVDAAFENMDVFAVIALLALSFIITYGIRALIAYRMLVNFNSIHVGIVVYFIQMLLCTVLLFTMLIPFIYLLAIAAGSFMGLAITIAKRPITIVKDAKDIIDHTDEMKDRVKDHLKDARDRFRRF